MRSIIGASPLSDREFLHPIPALTYELVLIVDFDILEVRSQGHVRIADLITSSGHEATNEF
jgi:hypothetical protein